MRILWYQHAAAFALAATDVIARGFRMKRLMPVTLWQAVRVNAYGDAAATLTPLRLGGEPARFAGYRSEGIVLSRVLSALGVELAADWSFVLAIGAVLMIAFAPDRIATFLPRLGATIAGRGTRWLVVAAGVLTVAGSVMVVRWTGRITPTIRTTLSESLGHVRELSPGTALVIGILTLLSVGARIAILPALVGHVPSETFGGSLLGSYILIYGQHVLPSPAGAGGVELAFVAGFTGSATSGEILLLLLAWRWYAIFLPATLGGVLLLARGRRLVPWSRPRR